jgi:metal-responsive CopG/Arc/MetJ family transcriptional regulator
LLLIPKDLLAIIDTVSKQQGFSRSKFISTALKEKLSERKVNEIKEVYDSVFSDNAICIEQLETVKWFETAEYDK